MLFEGRVLLISQDPDSFPSDVGPHIPAPHWQFSLSHSCSTGVLLLPLEIFPLPHTTLGVSPSPPQGGAITSVDIGPLEIR